MASPQGVFVRGLWSGLTESPYFASVWPKVYDEVRNCLTRKHRAEPCAVYCYGSENAKMLSDLGMNPRCLSDDCLINWRQSRRSKFLPNGARDVCPWGMNHWRHKLEICREAIREHGTIVWLDWDCCPIRRVPRDFWNRMAKGPAIQIPLRQFRRRQCFWRKRNKQGGYDRQIPHGAFMYCREARLLDRAAKVYDAHPSWSDEAVFAWLFEQRYHGWGPVEIARYFAEGYSPYCYVTRQQIGKPELKLFFTYSQ